MNIRFFSIFLIFISFASHPNLVQSQNIDNVELQELLLKDFSLHKTFQTDKKDFKDSDNKTSKNQNILNSINELDLRAEDSSNSEFSAEKKIKSISFLEKYFLDLTGDQLKIYGAKEFNQPQDDSLLFYNTVGQDYQLAPGDVIQITIMGLSPSNNGYEVESDGTITLDNMYPVQVDGMRLDQVNKLILAKILLDDASAEIFVRLKNARLVTVQISGNVKSPRTIAVPAYTPLSRVIAYSGGISNSGSLRNISLSQIGETTQTVDFYNFLQNPSSELDPLIKNGARIFVPFKGPTIAVTGFVNNPGIYELPNDKSEISLKNLLSITGTSFLPSGVKLKISYFDSNGQIATRLAVKNETLKEGEALQIGFIETRDLNISKVYGAVLKDFEIKINTPLSIKEVLKDGAVLSVDAYKSFALIVDEEVQAINLYEALKDDSITLPVGSDLKLFTKEEYLELVALDPNKTLNPLASKLISSNVAEIYLDGVRIAYIPIGQKMEFNEYIKAFYNPSPKTVYELALIERSTIAEAFDFKSAMLGNYDLRLVKGDRLFIFEDKFFNQLIHEEIDGEFNDSFVIEQFEDSKNINTDDLRIKNSDIELYKLQQELKNDELVYMQAIEYSRKILQKSNTIKISLDGKLYSILPFSEGMTSTSILNKLKGRLPKLTNEFVIYHNTDRNLAPKIKNINYEFKIKQNDVINFINQGTYRKLINSFDTTANSALLNNVRSSDVVKVYYDEKLVLLLSPNISFSKQKIFDSITNSDDFYKLFIGFSTKQNNDSTWTFHTYDEATFFSDSQNIISKESNIVYMFSDQYIRDKFVSSLSREELLVETSTKITDENRFSEFEEDAIKIDGLNQVKIMENKNIDIDNVLIQSNNNFSEYVSKSMTSKLRFISGAVMFPGTYPLADRVRLKDLINVVGVIDTKASSNVIVTKTLKENNELTKIAPEIFELNSLMENEIILSGEFYVDVPKAVNEAINGFVNLSGEFKVPGDYPFSRSESLTEIIQRAGGLTDTAFPLGAVLERKSVKAQERKSNNILAAQLEASVLTLAQSDIDGVGEQIRAVLGFAQQLRSQPTTGRMTINIMEPNNNLYLQDGDKLMLPKRPSHVSVVGAVQRTTVASYNQNKTYKDYIFSAGGLTKMADIRKSYVLLPNGESRLLENKTIIPAGSVVVVPPKIDKLSVLGLTDIISRVLGNIATSILAINNVN